MRPFDSISHKDSKILGRVILCHRMVAFLPTRGSLVGLRVAQITGCANHPSLNMCLPLRSIGLEPSTSRFERYESTPTYATVRQYILPKQRQMKQSKIS